MDYIKIIIEKTDWQFTSKEDDRNCEVVNINTKESRTGFITQLTSNGVYTIELKEKTEVN